jgi:hypothetical protein
MTVRIRRRDIGTGHRTATMTITTHRLLTSVDATTLLIAAARTSQGTPRIGADMTRAAADTAIETVLRRYGSGAFTRWEIDLDEDELGTAVRWAAAQVRRIWPALADPALAGLVTAHAPPLMDTLTGDHEPA